MSSKLKSYLIIAAGVPLVLILAVWFGLLKLRQDQLTDILFTKKENSNRVVIVEIDEQSINQIGQWPWPRAVFGDLVRDLNSAAVIGIDVNFKESSRLGAPDDAKFAKAISDSKMSVVLNAEIQPDGKISKPIESLAGKAVVGFPNLVISPDGSVRIIHFQRENFPSLANQLAAIYSSKVENKLLARIPDKPVRMNYLGPSGGFPSVSAVEILGHKIPDVFFKDKIVLIGATAKDLQDFHQTPFGLMSGVEIQANAVETLLGQKFFASSRLLNIVLIFVLAVLTVWLCAQIKKLASLILSIIGLLAVYNLAAFISFDSHFLLDLLYPNLSVIFSGAFCVTYQYFSASKEKKFIQDSFSRYLAPEIIEELVKNPKKLKLGGVKKNLTIFFSDIRGFTSISEGMVPEELSRFLNLYLTRVTNIILSRRGLVDKYIGDAVMAFWGAPLNNPNQAEDSVLAALEMLASLREFNEQNPDQPNINIGIGINSGEVTVGNMGSDRRFDYTVIGDSVNLASRLEGLNKMYGTNIIVSQSTREAIHQPAEMGEIIFREMDKVRVKGRTEPVTIYEVIPFHRQDGASQIINDFKHGLADYYQGNWLKATKKFEEVLKKLPNDGPTQVLYNRCLELKKKDPGDWQGVWEITNK